MGTQLSVHQLLLVNTEQQNFKPKAQPFSHDQSEIAKLHSFRNLFRAFSGNFKTMAWRCGGKTNAELIENLFKNNLITGSRVLDIGSGSGYLTAVLAELVSPQKESSADAGLARVVGLEHIKALRDLGERNMSKSERGSEMLKDGKVSFVVGDGRKGWTQGEDGEKGWDAIHVGAAAVELHQELVDQLRSPGRIFIPVEDARGGGQYIWVVDKDANGSVTKKKTYGVRYVPLTDAPK